MIREFDSSSNCGFFITLLKYIYSSDIFIEGSWRHILNNVLHLHNTDKNTVSLKKGKPRFLDAIFVQNLRQADDWWCKRAKYTFFKMRKK